MECKLKERKILVCEDMYFYSNTTVFLDKYRSKGNPSEFQLRVRIIGISNFAFE